MRGPSYRFRVRFGATALAVSGIWSFASGALAQETDATSVALTAGPTQMAEPAIAVDPADPRHVAVAADPYVGPPHIVVTTSTDGGASWSSPVTVLPDGFGKSYDPVVSFGAHGELVVAGGASRIGRPQCQLGSAIFLAVLAAGKPPSYRIARTEQGYDSYVDRPGLAIDVVRDVAYLTWTESSGPGAACRGVPVRSTTQITGTEPDGSLAAPTALASSGLPAPFGATPAVDADGTVVVAVGEHAPGKRSRVVLTISTDHAHTFSTPEVVLDLPPVAAVIAGIGGLIAPVPALAVGTGHRTAVAFIKPSAAGVDVVIAERNGTSPWTDLQPPADPATTELFPNLVYDAGGSLWLLSGKARNGSIDFVLRRRGAVWGAPITVGHGLSGRYRELGESLGLATSGDAVFSAVPVDAPGGSSLVVGVHRAPPPVPDTTTTMKPAAEPAPPLPTLPPAKSASHSKRGPRLIVAIPAGLVLGGVCAGWLRLRRRRRIRASERPSQGTTR